MDVLIRNISPEAVKMYERLAKNNKVSRETYLRGMLEDFAILEKNKSLVDRLEKQLVTNTFFLEKVEETMETLMEIMKEMIAYDNEDHTSHSD